MGSLYSLSLLALLLVAFVDQICGCEVKNEKNQCFVEGTKPSGKSSKIATSLFSIYHRKCLTF